MIECGYCKLWTEIPLKLRIIEMMGQRKVGKRKCTFSKDFVYPENEGCEHYIPGDYFWCEKNQERIHQSICIDRAKNKKFTCNLKCYQFKCILSGKRRTRNIENGDTIIIRRKK